VPPWGTLCVLCVRVGILGLLEFEEQAGGAANDGALLTGRGEQDAWARLRHEALGVEIGGQSDDGAMGCPDTRFEEGAFEHRHQAHA